MRNILLIILPKCPANAEVLSGGRPWNILTHWESTEPQCREQPPLWNVYTVCFCPGSLTDPCQMTMHKTHIVKSEWRLTAQYGGFQMWGHRVFNSHIFWGRQVCSVRSIPAYAGEAREVIRGLGRPLLLAKLCLLGLPAAESAEGPLGPGIAPEKSQSEWALCSG